MWQYRPAYEVRCEKSDLVGKSEARIALGVSVSEPEVQCGLRTDVSRSDFSQWTEGKGRYGQPASRKTMFKG